MVFVRRFFDWEDRPAVWLGDGRVFALLDHDRGWEELSVVSANDVIFTASGIFPSAFASRFPYADVSTIPDKPTA